MPKLFFQSRKKPNGPGFAEKPNRGHQDNFLYANLDGGVIVAETTSLMSTSALPDFASLKRVVAEITEKTNAVDAAGFIGGTTLSVALVGSNYVETHVIGDSPIQIYQKQQGKWNLVKEAELHKKRLSIFIESEDRWEHLSMDHSLGDRDFEKAGLKHNSNYFRYDFPADVEDFLVVVASDGTDSYLNPLDFSSLNGYLYLNPNLTDEEKTKLPQHIIDLTWEKMRTRLTPEKNVDDMTVLCAWKSDFINNDQAKILMVADGHGKNGEEYSNTAITVAKSELSKLNKRFEIKTGYAEGEAYSSTNKPCCTLL